MTNTLDAPYLSYAYILRESEKFLKKYHPSDKYPLPIERIIDLQLEIYIIGIPGLLHACETDGFLSSDLKEIYVDKGMYDKKPPRYNFTLAHEVGHFVLHSDVYKKTKIRGQKEWKEFCLQFPEEDLRWFEWQARVFGGLILVPPHQLKKKSTTLLKKIHSLDIKNTYTIVDRLIEELAKHFRVSRIVIQKRLEKDNILPHNLQQELVLNFINSQ